MLQLRFILQKSSTSLLGVFAGKTFPFLLLLIMLLANTSCRNSNEQSLFTRLDEGATGVTFRNLLLEDNPDFNILFYPYFYNGGGVAACDVNNDGLTDLFFTGNMVHNRLFINKGDLKFEDITPIAGISEKEGWCTGVTFADINGDGFQDIYICRSGLKDINYRKNLLYISNGFKDGDKNEVTFTEKGAEYGLDNSGYSTQASFFDYDGDGDLDLFLINQSSPEYSMGNHEYAQLRQQAALPQLENKLYRNEGHGFKDVTDSAGITSNVLTFSLGLSTADINQDGWPDIYIANDFNENDYYYINNKNGTFSQAGAEAFDHFSQYAMGCDVNDYNNDGLPDVLVLDMLSDANKEQKMHMGGDNYDKFQAIFNAGFQHQYMKNTLQHNNGDGSFSEIGQLAGISNTDWSWSPLMADFDNDGLKDVFITNGYKHDNTNMQFIKFQMDHALQMKQGKPAMPVADYISKMPGILLPNYIFRNSGNDHFENKVQEWGFDEPFDSHGAVYADLDNDGDLDIITNNTDKYACIYRNNAERFTRNNYVELDLHGDAKNITGIGSKIWLYSKDTVQYQEQLSVRGYQSSVSSRIHFGLGKNAKIDSIRVVWPSGKTQVLTEVKANQLLALNIKDAGEIYTPVAAKPAIYQQVAAALPFVHKENNFSDFKSQYLLNDYLSRQGPCMAKADVNGDGREDIFIGGASGQTGAILIQQAAGNFNAVEQPAFKADINSEDVAATFADVNGDGFPDLYVGSGGYEFPANDPLLQDRVYLNNGKGIFTKLEASLPEIHNSTSVVKAADFDGDGDEDIFIGTRVIPGQFPLPASSYLLQNNGKGKFADVTKQWLPALENIGLVTGAEWVDINKDKLPDLVVCGEWLPIKTFINSGKGFSDESAKLVPENSSGLWQSVVANDIDNDGDIDLILGNLGWNTQFRASPAEPIRITYKDYDGNGIIDPVFHYYIHGESYPAMPKDDITGQMPVLNKKYFNYTDYAVATTKTLFTEGQKQGEQTLWAQQQQTIILKNNNGKFEWLPLPVQAQYSCVYSILVTDANKDGKKDLLLCGNNRHTRIKYGEYNANHGVLLLGDGNGNFHYVSQGESGLDTRADVRSVLQIGDDIIMGVNDKQPLFYKRNN